MRDRVRRSRRGFAVMSIGLVAGVLMPVVGVAAGGPAAASVPVLDHFECYTAAATTTPVLRASFRRETARGAVEKRIRCAWVHGRARQGADAVQSGAADCSSGRRHEFDHERGRPFGLLVDRFEDSAAPGDLDRAEPVRHWRVATDSRTVAVPAVVEERDSPDELPVIHRAIEPRFLRVLLSDSSRRLLQRSRCPRQWH